MKNQSPTNVSFKKAVVLMSGGIDSAACVHILQSQGFEVTAAFVDYGQTAAAQEIKAVGLMAEYLGVAVKYLRASGATSFAAGEHIGRNSFFLFAALFFLHAPKGLLAMGLHSGTPYYDCSKTFADRMTQLIAEHTDGRTSFIAPFIDWSKKDVFDYFIRASLPIDRTYSCEAGSVSPCGTCASCLDRRRLGC